jgi:hypothetical protein
VVYLSSSENAFFSLNRRDPDNLVFIEDRHAYIRVSELSIAECKVVRHFAIYRDAGLQCRVSAGTGIHDQVPIVLVQRPHPLTSTRSL